MKKRNYYIVKNILIKDSKIKIDGQVFKKRSNVFNIDVDEHPLNHFRRVFRFYRMRSYVLKDISLEMGNQQYPINLGWKGNFYQEIEVDHKQTTRQSYTLTTCNKTIDCIDLYPQSQFTYHGQKHGIISDLDDTLIVSKATNFVRKIWLLFLHNPFRRIPVQSVRDFLNSLDKSTPFFYVTNSEYNLAVLYHTFLSHFNLPPGPVFFSPVRNLFRIHKRSRERKSHKFKSILKIMETFPEMNFTLIGDSGQSDTKTYFRVASLYPQRITKVVIRDIGIERKKLKSEEFKDDFARLGVDFELL